MRRGGIRWTLYVAVFMFFAFLWNLQHIYNFLEPEDESESVNAEAVSLDLAGIAVANGMDTDDRGEPLSTANLTNSLALSAIARAKSAACRRQLIETETKREYEPESLTPLILPRSCSMAEPWKSRRYLGCYADHPNDRLLKGGEFHLPGTNSIQNCLFHCIRVGQDLAGVQYGAECFCGTKSALKKSVPLTNDDSLCNAYKCPGNQSEFCGGYKLMAVYETGVGRKAPVNVHQVTAEEQVDGPPVKIVFLLQLNGRSSRQVRRMLKLLYRRKHFYYVHVDARQAYMYREMLDVEQVLPNVKLKRKRFSSIWGGASLLSVIKDSYKDLLDEFRFWPWDYVINLSEADMPLVSVDTVEKFLRKYRGSNFLRSAGNSTASFIKKQGLEFVFSECSNHMFRLGKRNLPNGIRFDGGSDWFVLHREFIEYAVRGSETPDEHPLAAGLAKMYETALLPAESFFHTLALNSPFCTTVADTNLKLTNWKRKQGCKCQYKHIVDWCGCSPNVLTMDEWDRLQQPQVLKAKHYFARKFDAMIDQGVIRRIEAQIRAQEIEMAPMVAEAAAADAATHAPAEEAEPVPSKTTTTTTVKPLDPDELPGFHAYWENLYHDFDEPMDRLRFTDYPLWLLLRSLSRQALKHVLAQIHPKRQGMDKDENEDQCNKRCGKIHSVQQLHVYQETDVFGGLIVQFNGTCSSSVGKERGRPWSLEAYVKRIRNTTKNADSGLLAEALLTLEVGTKFDVKEEIFRNYAGAMTVDKEIALRHHWDQAVLDGMEKEKRKVTIIFLDPDGENRGAYVQNLENPTGFEYTKLPITKSHELEAGIWTVQLRSNDEKNSLIAQTTFPLLPADNREEEEDTKFIDKLISPFYHVQYVCRTAVSSSDRGAKSTDDCENHFLLTPDEYKAPAGYDQSKEMKMSDRSPLCKQTYWSSFSPDPKSEISGFDWHNGFISPR